MALVLTEEQTMLRDSARDFLQGRAPVSHLRELRDSGYLVANVLAGLDADEFLGGEGAPDAFAQMLIERFLISAFGCGFSQFRHCARSRFGCLL